MRTRFFTLAAAALAGLTGLGVGLAVAETGDESAPTTTRPGMTMMGDATTMDQMHAAMRGQMPAEVAAQCDAMHASMPEAMRSMTPGQMGPMMGQMGSMMGQMGSMGSMTPGQMGPMTGPMAELHAQHHGG